MYCTYCGKKNEQNTEKCINCNMKLVQFVSVRELIYEVPNTSTVEKIKDVKTGLLYKEDLKKFLNSIEEGTTGIAQVLLEEEFEISKSDIDESYSYKYGNVQTLDGTPCLEAVRVFGYECIHTYDDKLRTVYILRYKLRQNDEYILIYENDPDYIAGYIKEILSTEHTELECRKNPITEDSIADKVFKGVGKLLGKKY